MPKYLQINEVEKYCEFFDDITETTIDFAETLVDEYVGESLLENETTEIHKLNRKMTGKLEHVLVSDILSVVAITKARNGYVMEYALDTNCIRVKGNGYFQCNLITQPYSMNTYLKFPVTELKIQYRYGYREVPDKLKRVVAMLAQTLAEKRTFSGLKSWTTLDTNITLFDDSVFTKDIRMILDGLVR